MRERRNREEEEDIEQSEARDEERGRILKPAANVTTPASPALMQAKAATTSFARLVKKQNNNTATAMTALFFSDSLSQCDSTTSLRRRLRII